MNIIITKNDEGIVTYATISTSMFVTTSQSTEICKDDQEAAQGILEYYAEGAYVAKRDIAWARANK